MKCFIVQARFHTMWVKLFVRFYVTRTLITFKRGGSDQLKHSLSKQHAANFCAFSYFMNEEKVLNHLHEYNQVLVLELFSLVLYRIII